MLYEGIMSYEVQAPVPENLTEEVSPFVHNAEEQVLLCEL